MVCHNPPSVLPPDSGVRHEIDLVPGTKYCVTRQWPLTKEQCDLIDEFFGAKHAARMVRESKSLCYTPTFCVKKHYGGVLCILVISLMRLLYRQEHPLLERTFFRTTRQDVQCKEHSTLSMVIIDCSCDQVINRLQQILL